MDNGGSICPRRCSENEQNKFIISTVAYLRSCMGERYAFLRYTRFKT